MDLISLRQSLENIIPRLNGIILQILDDHETQIKELIHIQLRKGERGDGQLISPQYSDKYARKKGFTVPDLKVDGSFWDSIYTEPENQVLKIDSDIKTRKGFELGQHLQKRYTNMILELTKSSREKLLSLIGNDLYKAIFKIT